MSTEWDIDRLDLAAYLQRIGSDGEPAPTDEALARLHRAHLASIPFENVDVVIGRGIAVDLDSVQAKLVHRRRGGYCYEHGVLFAAVLERLGFSVDRLLARIGGLGERPRARTHMTLSVRTPTATWLADVGFGSGILEPLPFAADGPRTQGAWTYDLEATGPHAWRLRERNGEEWMTHYGFDDVRQHPSDVVMANHFSSTFARSPFVGQLVAVRRTADSLTRLVDRRLTVTAPDWSTEARDLGDDEVVDALLHRFGIGLDADELAGVIDALPRA